MIIPAVAPCLFILLEKMPISRVGKNDDAASPKAKATVLAMNADGGLIPNQQAMMSEPSDAMRAHFISCLSVSSGLMIFFIKSCEMEVDRTRSRPAAVDNAAAIQPAMRRAITH